MRGGKNTGNGNCHNSAAGGMLVNQTMKTILSDSMRCKRQCYYQKRIGKRLPQIVVVDTHKYINQIYGEHREPTKQQQTCNSS